MTEYVAEPAQVFHSRWVGQVDPKLFDRFTLRSVSRVRVCRIESPTRKSQMTRPGILIMFGSADEEHFQIRIHLAKHDRDGGTQPGGLSTDSWRNNR